MLKNQSNVNKEVPGWKSLTCNETRYEDTGEVLDDIKESSSKMIGEVVKLELSCARPTRTSGEELLASVVFRVSKNSNILKCSIRHCYNPNATWC